MINKREIIEQVNVVKIIKIKIKRGIGTEEDPIRIVNQYWDMDGTLIRDDDFHEFEETKSTASSDTNS